MYRLGDTSRYNDTAIQRDTSNLMYHLPSALSANLRAREVHVPTNVAIADTMGSGFIEALPSERSNSRPERSQLLMASFFGEKRQCMTYLDPY